MFTIVVPVLLGGTVASLLLLLGPAVVTKYLAWRRARTSSDRSRRTLTQSIECPYYVLPVVEVLKLPADASYPQLLATGKLVPARDGMQIIFVAHEALGVGHPDPGSHHWHTLLGALRRMLEGGSVKASEFGQGLSSAELRLLLPDAFVWFPRLCMPQPASEQNPKLALELLPEFQRMEAAIPAYIERARLVLVLAPPVEHAELAGTYCTYGTYCSRGSRCVLYDFQS